MPASDPGDHVHMDMCRSFMGCKHTPVTKLPVRSPVRCLTLAMTEMKAEQLAPLGY